jgi:hypothetical protein
LPVLRSERCAFMLTGRTLTVAQDIYGSILGIFGRQLELQTMTAAELRAIAMKTLNLAREQARDDVAPFDEEAMAALVASSYGLPRQFNRNCYDVLEAAIRLGYEKLDVAAFERCLEDVQQNVGANIEPQIRHALYVAQKYGGFSQDNRRALEELGMGDFIEVLPFLDTLQQRDLLIRQEYTGGIRFRVAPRAAWAALPPGETEPGDRTSE